MLYLSLRWLWKRRVTKEEPKEEKKEERSASKRRLAAWSPMCAESTSESESAEEASVNCCATKAEYPLRWMTARKSTARVCASGFTTAIASTLVPLRRDASAAVKERTCQ